MKYKSIIKCCRMTRKHLRDYTEMSNIHGVPHLVEKRTRAEKYRRTIWAIILILSLSGCIYMINGILIKYQNNPIVVNFATEDTPIYDIPFPAVTICRELKYAKSEFNFTDIHIKIKNNKTTTKEELQKYHFLSLLCKLQEDDKAIVKRDEIFNETFFQTIDNANVSFMGKNMENFFSPVITDEGICYSFNILDRSDIFRKEVVHYGDYQLVENLLENKSRAYDIEDGLIKNSDVFTYPFRALGFGSTNDLKIQIESEYNNEDFLCSPHAEGFRVVLHNPYDIPRVSKHYISVPLGDTVTVTIEPDLIKTSKEAKRYKPEIRKCFLKNERPLMYFKIYTESNCRLECLTNYTLNTCGCVEFFMPLVKCYSLSCVVSNDGVYCLGHSKTKICGTGSFNCFSKVEKKMLMEELQTKLLGKINTKCGCLPLCTELTFNVQTSANQFIWDVEDHYSEVADPELSNGSEGYSLLRIYFKRAQLLALERNEVYGVVDLVSNFGGLLGLFVGFSLLSLVEIIYFFTIRIYCNGKDFNKSKVHTFWP